MENYTQIIITIVGVLGSASIWKYLEARLKANTEIKKRQSDNNDTVQFRDDLKNRVLKLEELLNKSSDEKDELRDNILKLTAEVHSLRVEVDYLKRENQRLKDRT